MSTPTPLRRVTIRFAGDSGDGMQLTGNQFTRTTAIAGNDLSTLPDYPTEIRAPAGTLYGVSGFQIQFGADAVHTPGDEADVLVAMNPAALKSGLRYLRANGIIIINTDAFSARNLRLANYEENPLDNGGLSGYQLFPVEMTRLTKDALESVELSHKEKERAKNFFALGIIYWLYNRDIQPTMDWIDRKFATKPDWRNANRLALQAGRNFAEATELFATTYEIQHAEIPPGIYRRITGNEAISLGFVAAGQKAGLDVFYASYPITPASDVLQYMAVHKNFGVKTFQAEDEIAAVGAAIGASFAGNIGITATSGPGMALKAEFMGLAVMTELPLVVLNVQRAGPSTGMPTKTEQSDLFQALYGRSGEAPVPVIAPRGPSDCFQAAYEAVRIAVTYMTPVVILSDAYLANGAEPWLIPDVDALAPISVPFADDEGEFLPYRRDEATLARQWAIPGMPGREHRLGGLEKQDLTGNVSYDPDNHHRMTLLRQEKIARIAGVVEPAEVNGPEAGEVLVLSWGSTHGAVLTAVQELQGEGLPVSFCHLRWLNPLPAGLGTIISRFRKILVPELNLGQLGQIIRATFTADVRGYNLVKGQPLPVSGLQDTIRNLMQESLNGR